MAAGPGVARPPRCRLLAPANAAAALLARLPQPLLLGLGAGLAWLAAPLLRRRRHYAEVNLALCFPQLDAAARRRLLRATLRNSVIGLFELLRAWFAPASSLRGLVTVEGIEHLHAARAAGRGVLLLTGHFPHAELGGRALVDASRLPVAIMVRRNNHPCIERWLDGARRRVFAATIGKKDMRALLRTLAQGGIVGFSADQDFSYQNAFVPFFGVPASTLIALSDLARRSNAVLLPQWFVREPDGRYRLWIEPPWQGWPSGDAVVDAARYMAELERVVRRYPDQYLWVHRRFKTRPPGEPDLYRQER